MTIKLTFYNYLIGQAENLTEDWYKSLNTEDNGVYSSQSEESIAALKEKNKHFHLNFFKVFSNESGDLSTEMVNWIQLIAQDNGHLDTSNSSIVNEFLRTEKQYLDALFQFSIEQSSSISTHEIEELRNVILCTMREIITKVLDELDKNQKVLLNAQSQMITELSAPVIQLTAKTGILPLVGEIDTYRASIIFEQVLNSCVEKRISCLIIDLSGVPIIDTMVAMKLFDLMKGLRLLGVSASISGIRPEIAQTAVQLGINLDTVKIYSNVDKAIDDGILV
ncbi:STAS domain-containing protein [Alkalicoccobacillus gibsonii]|uniref:STAS domain-containing protein n=1 Tax=Alkalicoccobacillus gibsonii TaxID=79881 RepID=A0ABU9VD44_9BACI